VARFKGQTVATNEINRRGFLRGALATSALLMASRSVATPASERRFAAVKVSRARLIREVVGLRPYRPQGFVVDALRIGRKLLVHNYGHGGAGITLSWGTASLALDLTRDFLSTTAAPAGGSRRRNSTQPPRRFAVVGCGVIGLATARLLQRRFPGTVTIYAKDLPPETTSNIAGGFWYPVSVFDPQQTTTKFADQFRLACQISNRSFQTLVGAEYGISWMETYSLSHNEASLKGDFPGGADLYPQIETHRDPDHYFGFPYVRQFSTMIIEPHIYLNTMLRDFFIAGGKVVVKEFRSREEIARLPESVIFNCSGLGARALFNDQELISVRGQLEVLLPQPEIDYCYLSGRGYMFPRRDGIILGGTWDHDDWSLAPKPDQTAQILEGHAEIMKGLAG
jgi:D-amino-acid oxidase